ncbi:hypothetical protein UA08_04394 [Talaromyces atroroseus]|uniref:Uncharacterized protein n=1 Tax=Talaromyces atroroseus TaxID=1441469 RepID=A0A1Q5Q817_TALAT|nr:hypothetical protein UA08_04394 [Talaromyces atroroseus]OKL60278.1 hypothetical protein UA08_04394 [Talaromyces atroroseus]
MMTLAKAASLLALISLPLAAYADVEFTHPDPGSTVNSGDILTAYWKDSGEAPSLLDLRDYDLFLCAGGPSEEYSADSTFSQEDLALLVQDGLFERGNSVSFQIQPNLGSPYPDAYFLKMISRGPNNATAVNYSQRFSVNGMKGQFSERVWYGLSLTNDADSHQDLRKRQAAGATALYTVPYPEQSTGLTKYAPMARQPGTTITAKSAPPVFPTSAFSVARTFLPIPTWQTTLTAPQTLSTSGIENPATPAPHPKDDMELFLRRWADDA